VIAVGLPSLMAYLAVVDTTCPWCAEPIGAGEPYALARPTAAHGVPRACLACGWASLNHELDARRRARGC
jgi:hypothetical protein